MKPAHSIPFGIVAVILSATCTPIARPGEESKDKPIKGIALEEALKLTDRPPLNGVVVKTPKAEVVEKGGMRMLRVPWEITYSGKRWPLVILEPTLQRETSGQTELSVIAVGKSGEAYRTALKSPQALQMDRAAKDGFLVISKDKAKAEGVLEVDLAEAKRRFLKYYPEDFNAESAPELYVWLILNVRDRGDDWDLDAWTGHLLASPVKVANPKW